MAGYTKKRKSNDPSYKRNKRRKGMMEPSVTVLTYEMPTSQVGVTRYIDLFSDLSAINRKLHRQGQLLFVQGITVTDDVAIADPNQALDVLIRVAGNTWSTHNAWTKGKALWDEMNQEVLEDNPSVQGKWADYKVRLDETMAGANTIKALDGASGAYPAGEWNYSTYVLPEHDVTPGTGVVLPAEEWTAHLCGPDDAAAFRVGLINAYEQSRATVFEEAPNVPAALPASFYLKLTDDGSQDPELAAVIADANERAPYSMTAGDYPGSGGFTPAESLTQVCRNVKNAFTPTMDMPGFLAPCGLVQVNAARAAAVTDNVRLHIYVSAGPSRGILAAPMGQ